MVVGGVTAAAALVAFGFRELQTRRSNIDQKVVNAVDASLGKRLLELRDLEEAAKKSLDGAVATSRRIERQLHELLATSEKRSAKLSALLERANDVVPDLDAARAGVPRSLVFRAMDGDLETATVALAQLLRSEQATSEELTSGGSVAAQRLGAPHLALDLYSRATALNPENADAAASAIRLRARLGALTSADAVTQITAVAGAQPQSRNAISEALNLFVDLDAYEAMKSFVDERLDTDQNNALLWRNRAVALQQLGAPKAEVQEAYAKSVALAVQHGEDAEVSNTARPYAAYLLRTGELPEAKRVLQAALTRDPQSCRLTMLFGDLQDLSGDALAAQWCYERARDVARTSSEQSEATNKLEKQAARKLLLDEGLLTESASPEMLVERDARPQDDEAPPAAA